MAVPGSGTHLLSEPDLSCLIITMHASVHASESCGAASRYTHSPKPETLEALQSVRTGPVSAICICNVPAKLWCIHMLFMRFVCMGTSLQSHCKLSRCKSCAGAFQDGQVGGRPGSSGCRPCSEPRSKLHWVHTPDVSGGRKLQFDALCCAICALSCSWPQGDFAEHHTCNVGPIISHCGCEYVLLVAACMCH